MRLALVTVGTRGDVQPYLHVAAALKARGHEIVFATHREFEPLIAAAGFSFRPMNGGLREILQTELGRAWLSSADRPVEYAKYAKQLFLPLQRSWYEDSHAATEGCDAVLFYAMAFHAVDAAERRGIPAIAMSPWPMVPTGHLPPPSAQPLEVLPRWALRPAWDLVLRLTFGALRPSWTEARARFGLPKNDAPTAFHRILRERIPCVHLYSEHVVPRPVDWPAHAHVAGFSFGSVPDFEPPDELRRFLERDDRPVVYIGFGSMTGHSPDALARIAVEAARRAGVRVVHAIGWAGSTAEADENVHVIDEVPHAWLFPRVSAVVHHGGVGTFAEGLRAGRPTVIAAFFADQPFWGRFNERLGTGPKTLMRRGLTEQALADAIRAAVHDRRHREAAARIAAKLAHEDGAARAADRIEELLGVSPHPPRPRDEQDLER